MHKIANADELERELRRLLAYAQTKQPSRSKIASELQTLSERLAAGGRMVPYAEILEVRIEMRNRAETWDRKAKRFQRNSPEWAAAMGQSIGYDAAANLLSKIGPY